MKVFLVLLSLPALYSCFSHSENEYALQSEKMCECVNSLDSISNLDTLRLMDFSELNYSRCASTLEVDPASEELIKAIKKICPALNQRSSDYIGKMKKVFNQ
jgi:hypothetical protein